MKKYLIVLMVLVIPLLILSGCTNPNGKLGPSWDLTAKLPLMKGTEENKVTVEDLLGNDLDLEKGFSGELLENGSEMYNIGEEIVDINLAGFSKNIHIYPVDNIEVIGELPSVTFDTEFIEAILADQPQTANIIINSTAEISSLVINLRDSNGKEIGSLDFGDISDDDLGKDIYRDWEMAGLRLSGNEIKIEVVGIPTDTGDLHITLEFPDNILVSSITTDVGKYYSDTEPESKPNPEFEQLIELNIDQELRDELKKISLDPEIFITVSSLAGMDIDIDNLIFTNAESSKSISVFEYEKNELNEVFLLDAEDLIDFILDSDNAKYKLTGKYELSGEQVTLKPDSKIGVNSIELKFPYEFTINHDINYQLDPEEIGVVDSETEDLLDSRADAVLVIENLKNSLPLGLKVEVYAADIPDTNLGAEEIENILYSNSENLLKRISISKKKTYNELPVEISSTDLDIFKKDNVYIGVKVIVPETGEKVKFTADDELTFDRIYLGLTGHVNK